MGSSISTCFLFRTICVLVPTKPTSHGPGDESMSSKPQEDEDDSLYLKRLSRFLLRGLSIFSLLFFPSLPIFKYIDESNKKGEVGGEKSEGFLFVPDISG